MTWKVVVEGSRAREFLVVAKKSGKVIRRRTERGSQRTRERERKRKHGSYLWVNTVCDVEVIVQSAVHVQADAATSSSFRRHRSFTSSFLPSCTVLNVGTTVHVALVLGRDYRANIQEEEERERARERGQTERGRGGGGS